MQFDLLVGVAVGDAVAGGGGVTGVGAGAGGGGGAAVAGGVGLGAGVGDVVAPAAVGRSVAATTGTTDALGAGIAVGLGGVVVTATGATEADAEGMPAAVPRGPEATQATPLITIPRATAPPKTMPAICFGDSEASVVRSRDPVP